MDAEKKNEILWGEFSSKDCSDRGRNDNSCNSASGKGKLTPVWVQDN